MTFILRPENCLPTTKRRTIITCQTGTEIRRISEGPWLLDKIQRPVASTSDAVATLPSLTCPDAFAVHAGDQTLGARILLGRTMPCPLARTYKA